MKLDELQITRPFPKDIKRDKQHLIDSIAKIFDDARSSYKKEEMIELLNKYGVQADLGTKGMALTWQIGKWPHLRLEKLYTEMSEI